MVMWYTSARGSIKKKIYEPRSVLNGRLRYE